MAAAASAAGPPTWARMPERSWSGPKARWTWSRCGSVPGVPVRPAAACARIASGAASSPAARSASPSAARSCTASRGARPPGASRAVRVRLPGAPVPDERSGPSSVRRPVRDRLPGARPNSPSSSGDASWWSHQSFTGSPARSTADATADSTASRSFSTRRALPTAGPSPHPRSPRCPRSPTLRSASLPPRARSCWVAPGAPARSGASATLPVLRTSVPDPSPNCTEGRHKAHPGAARGEAPLHERSPRR